MDVDETGFANMTDNAQQLRAEIVAGGESPSEQYELLDTLTLLRTRWMPIKEHNENVRQLEAEVQRLRAAMNPPYMVGAEDSGVIVDETIVWVRGA